MGIAILAVLYLWGGIKCTCHGPTQFLNNEKNKNCNVVSKICILL